MAGLAALPASNRAVRAEAASPLALRCKADALGLRDKAPATDVWSLGDQPPRFKRGERATVTLANDLTAPVALNWRGVDGAATIEPLLGRAPLAPSASETFRLPLRHAGTFLCDAALLGDGASRPFRALPLIVRESEPIQIDRDEVFLIEGWRVRPDGAAIAPGADATGTEAIYTVNGQLSREISLRGGERVRMRFINALPRQVIALKIEHHDITMMALDGQPAEPFLARNGAFALAPGGRADVFIDATPGVGNTPILMHDGEAAHPIGRLILSDEAPVRSQTLPAASALPSNGLPAHLDLKNALRIDLPFGGDQKDWIRPAAFAATAQPVFRAKASRVVVLSLTNRAQVTSVFHLHGHHFRLLDRLDDGWKPFWLDTIAIDAGQTQRIAFAAEYAGHWLIEAAETNWSAPKLLRWFSVE
ncbi:multicopper oxidase domain-containing protein [Bradyrhizobium sp.]|uniref:multicopper oxidase family protein n=1 Tax=Bradyrhizobium sp. TaxID=376 RepID=UPI00262B8CAA|nr:multicopper oxidase domain-containing protein [Bradyrhizobium sp.]